MIILTSAILGAFFVCFTYFGFYLGTKYSKEKSSIKLNKSNQEAFKQFINLMNYKGVDYEDKTN